MIWSEGYQPDDDQELEILCAARSRCASILSAMYEEAYHPRVFKGTVGAYIPDRIFRVVMSIDVDILVADEEILRQLSLVDSFNVEQDEPEAVWHSIIMLPKALRAVVDQGIYDPYFDEEEMVVLCLDEITGRVSGAGSDTGHIEKLYPVENNKFWLEKYSSQLVGNGLYGERQNQKKLGSMLYVQICETGLSTKCTTLAPPASVASIEYVCGPRKGKKFLLDENLMKALSKRTMETGESWWKKLRKNGQTVMSTYKRIQDVIDRDMSKLLDYSTDNQYKSMLYGISAKTPDPGYETYYKLMGCYTQSLPCADFEVFPSVFLITLTEMTFYQLRNHSGSYTIHCFQEVRLCKLREGGNKE